MTIVTKQPGPFKEAEDAPDQGHLLDRTKQLEAALIWCSGSADFGPGGQAEEGWNKTCRPLLLTEDNLIAGQGFCDTRTPVLEIIEDFYTRNRIPTIDGLKDETSVAVITAGDIRNLQKALQAEHNQYNPWRDLRDSGGLVT